MTEQSGSIRIHLLLGIAALLVVATFFYFFSIHPSIAEKYFEMEGEKVDIYARSVASEVNGYLQAAVMEIEAAASLREIKSLKPELIDPLLTALEETSRSFRALTVLDSGGVIISRPSKPERVGLDRSDREYFSMTSRKERTHITRVYVSTAGNVTMTVGTRILAEGGEFLGVLMGSLGLMDRNPEMYRAIMEANVPEDWRVLLLSHDDFLVAASHRDLPVPSLEELDLSGHPLINEEFYGSSGFKAYERNGYRKIGAVALVPLTGWKVIVETPENVVHDRVKSITDRIAFFIGLMFFGLLVAGLLAANRFIAPLQTLTSSLRSYGERGRAETIEVSGDYETSKAMRAFNEMIITRQEAEKALKESEERYRFLLNMGNDAIFVHRLTEEDRPGRILEVNNIACRRLGYTREELLSMSVTDIDDPESKERAPGMVEKLIATKDVVFEAVHLTREGRRIPVEIGAHLFDFGGEPTVLSVARDITERKETQRKLEEALRDLERQNIELRKLDKIKDGLVWNVTHELKTPVAKHAMQMEILKGILEGEGSPEDALSAIAVIESSIKRQESTIRNILTLSQLEAGGRPYRRDSVRLDKVLAEVVEDYLHTIEAYDIKLSMMVGEHTVCSDAEMLWHVFSNVVNNAIKYRRKDRPGEMNIYTEKEGQRLLVRIADNGIGLSEEEKEKAFERFYQHTPSSEGIGVGLTIARMIVQGLDGQIWIDSQGIGQGSTVTVSLPFPC